MTARKVDAAELKETGWTQRVAASDQLIKVNDALIAELLDIPASLAMTR
jgi:enoyl-CoA hydratase/carnithine racemase